MCRALSRRARWSGPRVRRLRRPKPTRVRAAWGKVEGYGKYRCPRVPPHFEDGHTQPHSPSAHLSPTDQRKSAREPGLSGASTAPIVAQGRGPKLCRCPLSGRSHARSRCSLRAAPARAARRPRPHPSYRAQTSPNRRSRAVGRTPNACWSTTAAAAGEAACAWRFAAIACRRSPNAAPPRANSTAAPNSRASTAAVLRALPAAQVDAAYPRSETPRPRVWPCPG